MTSEWLSKTRRPSGRFALVPLIAACLMLHGCSGQPNSTCAEGMELVFSCTTKDGDSIQACGTPADISLSLSKGPGGDALNISVPRETVTTTQWAGFGSSHTSSIDIPFQGVTYNVYQAVEEQNGEMVPAGGVVALAVQKDTEYRCDSDSIVTNIEGIDLKTKPQ